MSEVGASLLTRAVIADDLAAGSLVVVPVADLESLERESALVRLARGGPLPKAADELVALLREEVGALTH
jgi:hypothetical protein